MSSYAYIILVIYYLQKRSDPLLPILQGKNAIPNIIEGKDCGFDSEYEKYIPIARKNTDSDGVLFYNFFKYYSFFD